MKKNRRSSGDRSTIRFDNTFYDFENDRFLDPIETDGFTLIQAVDTQNFADSSVGDHRQCCDIELTCVVEGEMNAPVDGKPIRLKEGNIQLVFRGEVHNVIRKKGCRFLTLAFTVKEGSPFRVFSEPIKKLYSNKRIISNSSNITSIVRCAITEFCRYDPVISPLYFESLLGQLMLALVRQDTEPFTCSPMNDDARVAAIVHYIDNNYTSQITVSEICDSTHMSYQTLHSLFVNEYGVSPKKYLMYKKMEHAARMILSDSISLSKLSEELGYSSPYNFSRAFKDFVGVSIREFKHSPRPIENPLWQGELSE